MTSNQTDSQAEKEKPEQPTRPVQKPLGAFPHRPLEKPSNPISSQASNASTPMEPTGVQSSIAPTPTDTDRNEAQFHSGLGEHNDGPNARGHINSSSLRNNSIAKHSKSSRRDRDNSEKRNETPGPLKVRPTVSQPSKVTKHQTKARNKSPRLPSGNGPAIRGPPSQPSEEDLFYLLIQKLRQREDSEAASTALKEQMEAKIHEITQENENLQTRLEQANHRFQSQEAEIGSHRGLIDRWKVKFSKLRAFVAGMGNDYDCLRKDGQTLKSAQAALDGERRSINENLKHLYENTGRIEQQWSKHQTQITEVRHNVGSLQQSLSVTQDKVTDSNRLLFQEKHRVSTLEKFIKNYSIKQQERSTLIQEQQAETVKKLDAVFDHVEKRWQDSQCRLKAEVQPGLVECLELVKLLYNRESISPDDLQAVHDSIHTVSDR